MFKQGDYIKVKENTRLETGDIALDWAGEVQEVYQKEEACLVILDAATIDSLDDSYLFLCIEDELESFKYVFGFEEIELSNRRDTDEEMKKSLDNLNSRILELGGDEEAEQAKRQEKWIENFIKSTYFVNLTEDQKENADFIISSFMDFMYNYEYVQADEWDATNVAVVCLDIIPRKVTAEVAIFENYGEVLIHFFSFLDDEKHIKNAKSLIQILEKIKTSIPVEANNPNNWGMAKSMMMAAKETGVDLTNELDLKNFFMNQNREYLSSREIKDKGVPLQQDLYRHIGRNQKITVEYKDGKIMENIKFKKVESDLRKELCKMIKE